MYICTGVVVSFPDSFSCAIRRGVSEWAGSIRRGVPEGGGVRRERRRSLVNLAYSSCSALCQENLGGHAH